MIKAKNRVCTVEHAGLLESTFRRVIHNPKFLKKYIKPDMTVIDIGCGPGLYSIAMAEMTGTKGKVIAADLQSGMLKKLNNKIQGTNLTKIIQLHKTDDANLNFKQPVDFALSFYMVHEVKDIPHFLKEVYTILKPGAKYLIIDPKPMVSQDEFQATIELAEKIGFITVGKERVFLSRSVVLQK